MSTDRDVTRIVRSWLEEGVTALPDRVLDAVLDQLPATPQRRAWWPARRFPHMNISVRIALAAAAVVVVAFLGIRFLVPGQNLGNPGPSPTPTAAAVELPFGRLAAGTFVVTPFASPENDICMVPPQAGCAEDPADDSIRITFTVPDGWATTPLGASIWLDAETNSPPDGAALGFGRGPWLFSEPCRQDDLFPDIPVGPTVDDFAGALADHPLLEVTTPADVTLAGYSGKYVDLQVPSDISACPTSYRPWEPGIYAQGPSHRWHLWILDVDGVRVVVNTTDYAGTSAQRQAELQAIVDSIQIEP